VFSIVASRAKEGAAVSGAPGNGQQSKVSSMTEYRAPLRDIRFLVHDVLDFPAHYASLSRGDVTGDLVDAVLEEAARFTENELAPLRRIGDVSGCRLADGEVTTPEGFKEAYAKYIAGGWCGISGASAHGGQGLPESVAAFLQEMTMGANMAWGMYPGLSHGAIHALEAHGSDEQKSVYLTKLLSGQWTGTMCLTEAHCGSDLGLLRTQAKPNDDGSYAITGTKIFISAGEHDFAENIVHLVLARLPDAHEGIRGISMFLVPKFLPADGRLGARNSVGCSALEEKMGIHGNATCVMNFEDATGFLIGPEHEGMRCMFTMMNSARLVVGLQGLGQMEGAYQASLEYARERRQMRAATGPVDPSEYADPIIVHPDVRRMLLTQKALIEGGRAMAYYAAQLVDRARDLPDAEARAKADGLLDFMTPIVKAFLTEVALESVNHAVQIYGGHGFIAESGVEQYVRDTRITLIYEGTTQIQALDLLGRKILRDQAKAMLEFIGEVNAFCDAEKSSEALAAFVEPLTNLLQEWSELTFEIGARTQQNLEELGAASVEFLMYSGYVTLAYLWARMAKVASEKLEGDDDDPFLRGKLKTARFYYERVLPRTSGLARSIRAGASPLMAASPDEFDHV
jgi:alkylation response protein AidB-like acyl-CoA dehydrogenase